MNKEKLIYMNTKFGTIELNKIFSGYSFYYELFLDKGIQWSSRDEYRYHQTLFALPMLFLEDNYKKDILVLGGGDGLGVRELLKFNDINSITLVDISKEMVFLAKNNEIFLELNQNSLNNKKVKTIVEDAKNFIEKIDKKFDLIILDYPDPVAYPHPVNDLFKNSHYKKIKNLLKENGIIALQATSVYLSPNLFQKVFLEIKKSFTYTKKAKIDIFSYGDIGVIYASPDNSLSIKREIPKWFFFNKTNIKKMFLFFKDELPFYDDEILKDMPIEETIRIDIEGREMR